jgi:hypothetical protein
VSDEDKAVEQIAEILALGLHADARGIPMPVIRNAARGLLNLVVPASWLGRASANEDGEAFMRAWGRMRRGEPDPEGAQKCIMCGFPCEQDQTTFVVPPEFARFSRHQPPKGEYAIAHVACSHTMYRGRYDAMRGMVEDGVPHGEIIERLRCWPYDPEEIET